MDYGIRIAQKGYDAKECADRELAFSSAFQTLKIFSITKITGTIPTGAAAPINLTLTHNLGYLAPFIVIYNGRSGSSYNNAKIFTDVKQYTNSLVIGSIWEDFDGGSPGETIEFTVYLFLDDFSEIDEKNIELTGGTAGTDDDYGIRVSKEGYDVKTCDDDQLIFSSSFFSSIVNQKGVSTTAHTQITHNLGYVPDFMAYVKESGETYIRMLVSNWEQGASTYYGWKSDITDDTLELGFFDGTSWEIGHTFYYIIFKNKLN